MDNDVKPKESSQEPKTRKVALGRGLDALIPPGESLSETGGDFFQCDIDLILPNPYQPRRRFSETELDELARSIQAQGILQPLLVRKTPAGYELITGERRLRAAKIAGLRKAPVVVKDVSDADSLEMSIIENIQREDLNPLETADAYHRLMSEFNLTQEQAAQRVGKSRSAVANFIRLRQLPEPIKAGIREGTLSMGHARALLGAENSAQQNAAWQAILAKELSVRQAEALVNRLKAQKPSPRKRPGDSEDRYLSELADELSRDLGTRVQIKRRGQKGTVEIEFYGNEDLDRLIERLRRASEPSG